MSRLCMFTPITLVFAMSAAAEDAVVELRQGKDKIDIVIGGKPFTSYITPDKLPKPSLFPVYTPAGVQICRGYPLLPVKGESTDHPHHVGIFFACDRVNGNDFWFNSTPALPNIRHVKTTAVEGGKDAGRLGVVLRWIGKGDKVLFDEKRDMIFRAGKDAFAADLNIELQARDKVTIADPKNGLLGIRLADWLREPFQKEAGVIGISGTGTGKYLNSRGEEGEKGVWGRRASWVALHGEKDGKAVGIAIFDHPKSFNHPTYWHARGYGLFAANPVGQGYFETTTKANKARPLNLILEPGEKRLFRYRILVYDGRKSQEQLEKLYRAYTGG